MHTPRQLILPSSVRAKMLAAVIASPDEEVCGLLTGLGEEVVDAHAVHNIATEPWHRFDIDPQEQFNILRRARDKGLRVIGHYHSHPNGVPQPSSYDLAMANDPEAVWCIIGLKPTVLRAFVCAEQAQGFAEIPIRDAP